MTAVQLHTKQAALQFKKARSEKKEPHQIHQNQQGKL